ncbi:MAG: adenosylcobinamide-GDP ribazoletransferase, partial [Actinomycetota bacterium]|nr:adenosylcobinamide-GDP ribazoletransferase [Actinomycetota bacterium]
IMSDSTVGAFGVTTLVLIALVQTVALTTILQHASLVGWAVLASPVLGRFSATCAAWLGRPARLDGLGVSVMRRPDVIGVAVAAITVVVGLMPLVLLLGVRGWIVAGTGLLISPVVPHLVSMRFGGVTGDVMGASVLLTETIFLFVAAVVGVI